jgi:hypothetical protein
MARLSDVNWSEVVRNAIQGRIEMEENLRGPVDRRRAIAASRGMDALRESIAPSEFDSAKEIRKWRDRNWQS